jgi:GNAT superfamily N-acetyltransferase
MSRTRTSILAERWWLHVRDERLLVRPSTEHDLAGVAVMHRRCSARSLLARYRLGGRPPAVIALDAQLRGPLSYLVISGPATGSPPAVLAVATVGSDPAHGSRTACAGILVEDSWQGQGIGRELARHLAAAAALSGHTELVAYAGSETPVAQRLLVPIGPTRLVLDGAGGHLHTALPSDTVGGLGPLRAGRVVWDDDGAVFAADAPRTA